MRIAKMKIIFNFFIGIIFLKTIDSIQEKLYEKKCFFNSFELLGNTWVAREVTSLHGTPKVRCVWSCTALEGCVAFVHANERCILTGETSVNTKCS